MKIDDSSGKPAAAGIDDDDLAHIAKLAGIGLSVAVVVHEARQPLSALRIALQLACESEAGGEPVREYLEDALSQSRRIEDLLERIRDYLQPGDGPEEVGLERLIRRVLGLLDWQLRRGGVKVETRFEADLPPVKADHSGLEQVLHNLLLNARDALVDNRRGGTITLDVRRGDDGEVLLLVGDDGPGVPRRLEERVFEPFFSTKPRDRGTGLGLFISRRIARKEGGDLELVTGAERDRVLPGVAGAVFCLRLPAMAPGRNDGG